MAQDLSKLTVPQLKALCKEHGFTGYSKLTKAALLQKLSAVKLRAPTQETSPLPAAEPIPRTNESSSAIVAQPLSGAQPPAHTTSIERPSGQSSGPQLAIVFPANLTLPGSLNSVSASISSNNETKRVPDLTDVASTALPAPVSASGSSLGSKRKHLDIVTSGSVKKKKKSSAAKVSTDQVSSLSRSHAPSNESNGQPLAAASSTTSITGQTDQVSTVLVAVDQRNDPPVPQINAKSPRRQSTTAGTINGGFKVPQLPPRILATSNTSDLDIGRRETPNTSSKPKRFKPLVITKPRGQFASSELLTASPRSHANQTSTELPAPVYLDFPSEAPVHLKGINFPPSVAQRKRVECYAIILSGLAPESLSSCTLTSRMIRYATYLSAYQQLRQSFSGQRLDSVMQNYSTSRTNMWPYLRQRQRELSERKRIFGESFLREALGRSCSITDRLWGSPDHEKQATVAIRFLLTRFWFLVSLGSSRDHPSWRNGIVTEAQMILKDEIWAIKFSYTLGITDCTETLYILEATGEVIGLALPEHNSSLGQSDFQERPSAAGFTIRADWSQYIAANASPSGGSTQRSLIERISWTNHEEYDKGISKLWLRRVSHEGPLGAAKRVVAERYILACVVANGISGRWMSATEMRQEFDGLPEQGPASRPVPKARHIQLFLPAHHHVESLHFTSVIGTALHPALAVVRTPAREYYILKDNGMQIGCEEEGVAESWMTLIGCTNAGLPQD